MSAQLVDAQLDAILHIEHALLKVPFEQLNKAFRNAEKIVEKELQSVMTAMDELCNRQVASAEQRLEVTNQLDTIINKLTTIRRKLNEINAEEETFLRRCDVRISHLENMAQSYENSQVELQQHWSRVRLDRILVDHLLREGYYETAIALAQDNNLQDLVDVDLFVACRKVEHSLHNRSCTECLQWCSENRSKLRKLKSTLEFNLRLQEYIELVRSGKFSQAIPYARKYLTLWMDTHAKDIQRALALLAFPNSSTKCERYRQLYDPIRWQNLAEQFRSDNFLLYSLTNQSLLSVTLQAGLSALKTPQCYELDNKNLNCPVCNLQMGQLARSLPCSHHTHSAIVCRITGAVMDADNPPMMLPNGNVYSFQALENMQANTGQITDPRTGDRYKWTELRKIFIT